MLLYADYKTLVIQNYQKKRGDPDLHTGLIDLSPVKLREACMAVCRERYSTKDARTLREFFGQGSDKSACLKAIEELKASKFKPLGNFLRELTGDTSSKNIELLAWLIDFQPRPFVYNELPDQVVSPSRQEETEKSSVNVNSGPETPQVPLVEKESIADKSSEKGADEKVKLIFLVCAVIILLAIGIGIYLSTTNKPSKYVLTGREACMFWAGDHYQPISCGQKIDNAQVRPLNSEKVKHFYKITRPDTITENALGSVWYVKYGNTYECYTDSGNHPMDSTLKLKLLTDYVLIRYIHPGMQPTAVLPQH